MKLKVARAIPDQNATPGELYVDEQFECFTLEPSPRNVQFPSIPADTYEVRLLPSARFGELTPHILNVPDRSYIEIHPGNKPGDTEGCTLVGETQAIDWVGSSRFAFEKLMSLLHTATDPISITFVDYVAPDLDGEIAT